MTGTPACPSSATGDAARRGDRGSGTGSARNRRSSSRTRDRVDRIRSGESCRARGKRRGHQSEYIHTTMAQMRLDKKSSFARILTITGFACCLFIDAGRLSAQVRDVTAADFSTASGFEDYLRVLQISGIVAPGPWSLRSFSQRQIERMVMSDSAGPWRLRGRYNSGTAVVSAASATTIYNTKFAYGSNDGPIWAGRALTLAASGGVTGRYGPVSYAFAPMAFWARNRWFRILNNGAAGLQAYNHGVYIGAVDLPQRFGEDPYFRVDPGQSSVSVDTKAITVGLSTANEWIGPATEHAFLLSNNAPGFPHLFMATGDGVNVWLARVHAKVMWGKLAQSDYSSVT